MKFDKRFWQGALIAALLALSACVKAESHSALLLGGDIFLARGGEAIFTTGDNPWGDLLTYRQSNDDAYFAVNLESPLGLMKKGLDQNATSMNLCAPPESVHILEEAQINLAASANNHAKDCSGSAENSAQQILEDAGIINIDGQGEILFQEILGRKVAFATLNDYSETYDLDAVLEQVKHARKISELVVISIHWGQEYQVSPTQHQRELAAKLVDAGADIIWGHHPHVLQPMQWMQSKSDGNTALVMYSLGNLLSDQWMLPDAMRSVVVRIDFDKGGIQKVEIIPVEMDFSSRSLRLIQNKDQLLKLSNRLNLEELKKGNVEVVFAKQLTD
jgi:poly-gamma-glutamate synthesis protein (capsule biosynthesis protein)